MWPASSVSKRLGAVIAVIVVVNVAALAGWLNLARSGPAIGGICLLAYLLGMRHAFDLDHIAAIDNVTRRLRHAGQRPVGVGLFFSLGHSTIVIITTIALVLAGRYLRPMLPLLHFWGLVIGTMVSVAFLLLLGIGNTVIVRQLWQERRALACQTELSGEVMNTLLENRGLMARLLRAIFRRIDRSSRMYYVGLLFGLGFDTASEMILLVLTAGATGSSGLTPWSLLALPLLFAAGMILMDSLCSVGLLRLYDWSIIGGRRTWMVNTSVTGLSVLLAFVVGFIEIFKVFDWPLATLDGSVVGIGVAALVFVVVRRMPITKSSLV